MPLVTKESFLGALTCPTYGWHLRHDNDTTPTVADQFRMEEGQEVHRRARALYYGGNFAGDLDKTAALMADSKVNTIFEAAFEVDGYASRPAIMRQKVGAIVMLSHPAIPQ